MLGAEDGPWRSDSEHGVAPLPRLPAQEALVQHEHRAKEEYAFTHIHALPLPLSQSQSLFFRFVMHRSMVILNRSIYPLLL